MVRAERAQREDGREVVKRGGFPAVALEMANEQQRSLWFEGYTATYLERDLRDLHDVADLRSFQVMMKAVHINCEHRGARSAAATSRCQLPGMTSTSDHTGERERYTQAFFRFFDRTRQW